MRSRNWLLPLACLPLASCSGVFESDLAAPQAYVLRLPPASAAEVIGGAGRLVVSRPEAAPVLPSERIALRRRKHPFNYYAASRWAAPAPDVVSSVMIDALRA